MSIVYFCKLVDNIKNDINPKFYIGSKQNCSFNDGLIFDKQGKRYNTSSKYVKEYVKCGGAIHFDIICDVDDIDELLEMEKFYQKQHNAVLSVEFANMSYATSNNFVKSNYVTVKSGNKFFRTHASNLLSHYNHLTKNYRWMNNGNISTFANPDKISDYLSNGFVFGRISHMRGKCNYPDEARKRGLKKAHKFCKGKSRRQNIITGQMLYVNTNEIGLLNKKIWVTPEIYNVIKNNIVYECIHCGKTTLSKANYERWHNDNCKLKKGNTHENR